MIIISCVDDSMGMAFNHRRQSQDRLLRKRLLEYVGGHTIWMSPYSFRQFTEKEPNIYVAEDYFARAGAGEFCFIERELPSIVGGEVEALVLYHWNCCYPTDTWFDMKLDGFVLKERNEFAGSSHPKITEEIYIK